MTTRRSATAQELSNEPISAEYSPRMRPANEQDLDDRFSRSFGSLKDISSNQHGILFVG